MATDTTSPAYMWAREQERKRAAAKQLARQRRVEELVLLRTLVLRVQEMEQWVRFISDEEVGCSLE